MDMHEQSPLIQAHQEAKVTGYVIVLAIFAGIGGLLFGLDTGITSGALIFISEDFHLEHSPLVKDVIVSGTVAGAIFGAILGHFLNSYGRKVAVICSCVVFIIGSAIMALSPTVTMLILGRVVVGLGVGISSMTIPVYLAESAPPAYRGAIVSINVLMITTGQFIASVIAVLFAETPNGWRYMLGTLGIPALVQLIGIMFLTESPRWLVNNGKENEARRALYKLRNSEAAVEAELAQIQPTNRRITCHPPKSVKNGLIIGLTLQFLQQVCGINTIMYYGATIIQIATGAENLEAVWWNLAVALSNAVFTLVGVYTIDKFGRRRLLLVSLIGVTLSLLCLATSFIVPISHYYSILFLVLYLVFFAPGMGPVPWAINAEIYPFEYRSAANSLASMVNWIANLTVSLSFLVLMEGITPAGTFYLYAAVSVLAFVFVWFKVPETKGLSIEEIGKVLM